MNLLDYINLHLERDRNLMSDSSVKNVNNCVAALKAYIGDGDCDIRKTALSDFLFGFGSFMVNEYDRHYSPSTATLYLRKTLRKYIREAIADHFVPNHDAVLPVIHRLQCEVWDNAGKCDPDEKDGDKDKEIPVSRLDLGMDAAVMQLVRRIDFWASRNRQNRHVVGQTRSQRDESLKIRCAALYLFGLLTYGLEVREILSLKIGDAPGKVYLEKTGTHIELSDEAMRLVDIYNGGAHAGPHLFSTLDRDKYYRDADTAAETICGHISAYFADARLPLFKRKSIAGDWLNVAIERGLPSDDVESIVRYSLGEADVRTTSAAIDAAQARISGHGWDLGETWYLLCMVSTAVKRDSYMRSFAASGILGDEKESAKRIYAPDEWMRDKGRGQVAALSRYLFFRGTPMQVEFANLFSPDAYVLRNPATGKFARVSREEIENLQRMLHDFPDAVELTDGRKWLERHNAEIVEGCKALIRSGSLTGMEATVVRIKGKDTDSPTYILEYIDGALRFQTNLSGIEIEIVKS